VRPSSSTVVYSTERSADQQQASCHTQGHRRALEKANRCGGCPGPAAGPDLARLQLPIASTTRSRMPAPGQWLAPRHLKVGEGGPCSPSWPPEPLRTGAASYPGSRAVIANRAPASRCHARGTAPPRTAFHPATPNRLTNARPLGNRRIGASRALNHALADIPEIQLVSL